MSGVGAAEVGSSRSASALYWLALGTFAIGTEGFMIAAILPKIAADLSVSIPMAGTLVSIFALSYALSSPVLTALTAKIDRRRLLTGSMAAFATLNVVAATAHGYWALATSRVLLACAAGLYTPNANSLASTIVAPERRGRAIAIVNGGLTVAIAIGVPLGAFVGHRLGWRATFLGVAGIASLAVLGLMVGLRRAVGSPVATATLAERVRVVRRPKVAPTLLVTTAWATGTYTVYTFIGSLLTRATTLDGSQVGYALCLWGLAAGAGLFLGGNGTDRVGTWAVLRTSLGILAFALAGLAILAHAVPAAHAALPILAVMVLWGASGWSFFPAQQTRLIETVGAPLAAIALSLNASFMYLGFAIGAALGGFTIIHFGVENLGFVGATCEVLALGILLANQVRHTTKTAVLG